MQSQVSHGLYWTHLHLSRNLLMVIHLNHLLSVSCIELIVNKQLTYHRQPQNFCRNVAYAPYIILGFS